ncbi:unnamed protein product [Pleuronectes platessa]|uniref:Uncharacterized protein n=1 Tax=Pleuronectes platessa TaxID=8262 RepID=A0A9N7UZV0_PLEPL|nr:unnamed protein product [Pleuronectes platessa]
MSMLLSRLKPSRQEHKRQQAHAGTLPDAHNKMYKHSHSQDTHGWISAAEAFRGSEQIETAVRGPTLAGNDCSISNFMHRHSLTASHLETLMPHEDEIGFLLYKNKTSLDDEWLPCKDCNCVSTKEPRAAIERHRGSPSQLKRAGRQRGGISQKC